MEIELRDFTKHFVVFLVAKERDTGVLVAPNRVHHGECDQHASGDHRIYVTKFPGLGAAADDSAEQSESAGGDLLGVEAREIRELVQLAKDESVEGVKDRGADKGPVAAHCAVELFAGRTTLARRLFTCLDSGDRGLPHYFAEELFLIGEVEVDGAFGDTSAGGDVLEPGFGESTFAEDLERGLDDLLGPVLGSSAPLWRFCCG